MKKLFIFICLLFALVFLIQLKMMDNNKKIEKRINNSINILKDLNSNQEIENEKQNEDLIIQINDLNNLIESQIKEINYLKKEFMKISFVSKRTGLPFKAAHTLIKNSLKKKIRPSFISGLYEYESSFNPRTVNPISNATGLGQFLPSTARWIASINNMPYSYEMLKDPVYNINLTFKYLDYLFKKYDGDEIKVLKEYGDQTSSYPYIVISRGNKYRDIDRRIAE